MKLGFIPAVFILISGSPALGDMRLRSDPKPNFREQTVSILPESPVTGQVWINDHGIKFAWIPPGSFHMGSPPGEPGRRPDEGPVREVNINDGFWLGIFEVTQGQWTSLMGKNPSTFKECGENCPVETVSWHEVRQFIDLLNNTSKIKGYRLPTEAEWEYAARAGTTSPGDDDLESIAWYEENASGTPRPVGLKLKNAWDLYDMLGNVWEWCSDSYEPYPSGMRHAPGMPEQEIKHIRRGCSWSSGRSFCRVACRSRHAPEKKFSSLGFRLAFSRPQTQESNWK